MSSTRLPVLFLFLTILKRASLFLKSSRFFSRRRIIDVHFWGEFLEDVVHGTLVVGRLQLLSVADGVMVAALARRRRRWVVAEEEVELAQRIDFVQVETVATVERAIFCRPTVLQIVVHRVQLEHWLEAKWQSLDFGAVQQRQMETCATRNRCDKQMWSVHCFFSFTHARRYRIVYDRLSKHLPNLTYLIAIKSAKIISECDPCFVAKGCVGNKRRTTN